MPHHEQCCVSLQILLRTVECAQVCPSWARSCSKDISALLQASRNHQLKSVTWLQAKGKAEDEDREEGEIADSDKQVKAEEKKQKAREDAEAAQRELKVCLKVPCVFVCASQHCLL